MSERTYTTAADTGRMPQWAPAVESMKCRLKKITTTDEGAVSLAIEIQVADDDSLEQIRDLIRVQQGEVMISIAGVQGELPL